MKGILLKEHKVFTDDVETFPLLSNDSGEEEVYYSLAGKRII